jgi:hypothetical protein
MQQRHDEQRARRRLKWMAQIAIAAGIGVCALALAAFVSLPEPF